MTINVGSEGRTLTYTGTGIQEAIKVEPGIRALGNKTTVIIGVQGGSNDVFTFQEKLGGENGDWINYRNSINGIITNKTLTGIPEEFRLNISANASGSIKLYITVRL